MEDRNCCTFAKESQEYDKKIGAQEPLLVNTLGQISWINHDQDHLSVSTETDEPISGNGSLRVDVRPAATVEETVNSSWNVISTDFVAIKENVYYNYSLDVSAKDMNQLHSKVFYYDANKTEIKWDFIFGGTDGTFKKEFGKSILSPNNTKYAQFQMWVRQSAGKNASFLIDNVKIVKKAPSLTISDINNNEKAPIKDPFLTGLSDDNDVLYLENFDHPVKIINYIGATINDPSLTIETVFKGIEGITNIAFLGPDDILYLERMDGTVMRIVNGTVLEQPLIKVNVTQSHGLVGITVTNSGKESPYVFLYYTEALLNYTSDLKAEDLVFANRIYRYELVNNNLMNQKLILDLPAFPGPNHHGGELAIGPDSNLYAVVGDVDGFRNNITRTKAQNYIDGTEPDGRAGILYVTQDGNAVGKGILGDSYPLNLYYAYGIRNSFGMDFDPVTGNLWDTENGPDYGDEINRVEPGFNSGHNVVNGKPINKLNSNDLEDFGGRGKYSDPEFSWGRKGDNFTIGPTAIKFLNSNKLGQQYENDLFVADVNYGNIYHFDLNKDRTGLSLKGPLQDKVADKPSELKDVIFAKGFGGITDLQVGPDGYLYILSGRSIFRVVPNN